MRRDSGFSFSRWLGILVKEFIQLKRDRLTFGMIVGIPIIQLLLFGFAINSDPNAPIFDFATYGIVGNAMTILPALTKAFQKELAARVAVPA